MAGPGKQTSMTTRPLYPSFAPISAAIAACLLAACGGGGSTDTPTTPTDGQRLAAASQTANSHSLCSAARLGPYYWEIGDAQGRIGGGQVGAGGPARDTLMAIASASKWIYAAYVLQKAGARDADAPYLNFTSGYTQMVLPTCDTLETIESCLGNNDELVREDVGRYSYGSGHMQVHASRVMGLGAMRSAQLTSEVATVLGAYGFTYVQPQLAGGLAASTAGYATFLRDVLNGQLRMGAALGTHKVCTNPVTCSTAINAPVPTQEQWNYSLGHWVEDDPKAGDHAYSSAGAFGFYPWIDAGRTHYGVLARRTQDSGEENAGYRSAECGRLIRKAWHTGVAITG